MPGHFRQRVRLLALQNNVQIAFKLAVLTQRRRAEDFFTLAARIVAIDRHDLAAEEALHRSKVDGLSLNMAGRCGIGQQRAVRGDDVQLNAGVKGHQPAKQRFQRAVVNPALRVQNRFTLDNLLRQPARQPLHHRITVLHTAVELHRTGDGGAEHHQQDKQQRQALAEAKAAHHGAPPQICSPCPRRCE